MEHKSRKEILKDLWSQFIPLSLSDVAMAMGDPLHHWALSNTVSSRESLASFGIGKSIAVFFEAPIIMILHSSNALGGNHLTRNKLKKFSFVLGLFLSILLLLSTTPIFFPEIIKIFDLSDSLAYKTRIVLLFLILWPFLIAVRRYHQGLLIRYKFGKSIGNASLVRIIFVASVLSFGVWENWPGEILAGVGLIGGIFVETMLILYAFKIKKTEMEVELDSLDRKKILPQNYHQLSRYVLPLSFSMMIIWGGRALLTAVVARSVDMSLSLAVWPVAWGIVVLVANTTRMVQQVIIGNTDNYRWSDLIVFAWSVGLLMSAPLVFLVLPYLGDFLLKFYLGGDIAVASAVQSILHLGLFFPLLTVFQNVYQGLLIREGKTQMVNASSFLSVFFMLAIAYIMVRLNYSGAQSAMTGMLVGLFVEFLSLYIFSKKLDVIKRALKI